MSSVAALPRQGAPSIAWPPWARTVAAVLIALGRASPALLAVAFALDPTIAPRILLGVLLGAGALPVAAARLLARAFAARIVVGDQVLRIERADLVIEIPRAALARLEPWRVPLPGSGVALRLASAAKAPVGIEAPPATLLDAAGGGAGSHPSLLYAAARRRAPLAIARRPLVQFGLLGLAMAAALFRAQQVIGFGGLLGQYRLEGAFAWLRSLADVALWTLVGLVLWAGLLRVIAELSAFALAWVTPRRADAVRLAVEWAVAIGYYAGVPGYLAFRFLVL